MSTLSAEKRKEWIRMLDEYNKTHDSSQYDIQKLLKGDFASEEEVPEQASLPKKRHFSWKWFFIGLFLGFILPPKV